MKPVTFTTVNNCRKVLGFEWRNEPQRICAAEILQHDRVIFQAYRQFMKSWFAKLVGAAYVFNGGVAIVAAPTLPQASRIIYPGIKYNAANLLKFAKTGRREPDTTTQTLWWKGRPYESDQIGGLLALSANETSKKNPEGYTGDILIIDEGHDVSAEMIGVFTPMLSDSRQAGTARVIVSGVGGHKTSAIETLKGRGYHLVSMPASRALEIDPTLEPLFSEYQSELSEWEWDKYFECKELKEGLRHMHPVVPGKIPVQQFIDRGMKPVIYIGIDIGRMRDETVVKVLERYGDVINEVDEFRITGVDFLTQADAIFKFVDGRYRWHPSRIGIELNGMGVGLYDILNQLEYFGVGGSIIGVWTDENLEFDIWNKLCVEMREGRFGVESELSREHYEALMYNVREKDAKLEFEHSDPYMALCMAFSSMAQISAI